MSVINSNWTVSAHGYENPNPTADHFFEVPEGVTVHFYVKSGESLSPQVAVPMWEALTAANGTKYADVGYPPVETFESGKTCPDIFIDRKTPKTEEIEKGFDTGIWQNGDTLAKWADWGTIPWAMDGIPTTPAFLSQVVDHVKELVADADEEDEKEIELHVLTCRAHHGWNWETNDWDY